MLAADPLWLCSFLLSWILGIDEQLLWYTRSGGEYGTVVKNVEPTPSGYTVFIEYLDANNLYGCAMSEYLPYGGFKWFWKKIQAND
jgi:hypothetical protein